MVTWRSIPEFAKEVGFTPEYIRKLVRSGKIAENATKPKGKRFLINPDLAKECLKNNISYVGKHKSVEQNKTKQKPKVKQKPKQNKVSDAQKKQTISDAGLGGVVSLAEAQKLKENYIAALKKIELEERRGDLLQKTDVEKEAFEIARGVRDAILNIPDRISAELASMTDTHKINDKLITEITQALEELSS